MQGIFLGVAIGAVALSADARGTEQPNVRRIAPERFPELRLQGDQRPEAVPLLPPSRERPQGHCDRLKSDWIFCLQATVRMSEVMLQEVLVSVEGVVDRQTGVSPFQREAFQRGLREADRRFRALRDHECQALVMSEPRVTGQLYEARLICQIERNLERITTLRQRYQLTLEPQ